MPATQKSILSTLLVGKKHLIIFLINLSLNIIFCRARLMYYLEVDNKAAKKLTISNILARGLVKLAASAEYTQQAQIIFFRRCIGP